MPQRRKKKSKRMGRSIKIELQRKKKIWDERKGEVKHNAAYGFCDVIRGWDALRVQLHSLNHSSKR